MKGPIRFPDEIADELKQYVHTGSVVRLDYGYKTRTFTTGRMNYGLYASDTMYKDSETGNIVKPLAVALLIYDLLETGRSAYIDDYQIK